MKPRTSARWPAQTNSGPTSSPFASANAFRSRANRWRASRNDHHGTSSSRRSTASISPLSLWKRPRSTVENTSRLSRMPSLQRVDSNAASSFGKLIENSRSGCDLEVVGDPAVEVGERAGAERLLLRHRFLIAAQPRAIRLLGRRAGERREQAEIDVHWLERACAGIDGLDVAASDMAEQGAERRGLRRRCQAQAARLRRSIETCNEADAGGFHITLAAGHLPCEAQLGLRAQPKLLVQQLRRVQEGVAVQPAEPRELGLLQARDAPEYLLLCAVFQLGLESDHVVERAELVVLAQLDDRIGLDGGIVRICQTHRLHRPVPQGLVAALRHHFNGQAAVEIGRVGFPFLEVGLFARE